MNAFSKLNVNESDSKSEMIFNPWSLWANMGVKEINVHSNRRIYCMDQKDEKIRIWIRNYTFKKVKSDSSKKEEI